MAKDVADLVGKLNKAADRISSNAYAVEQTALHVKTVLTNSARAAGVGRGVGRSKIASRIGVRYDVKGQRNATAVVRFTGPAHLINNPTKAHPITPRGAGGSRKSRAARATGAVVARALTGSSVSGVFNRHAVLAGGIADLAGHPVAYAHHPGTRGKRFFEAGREIAERTSPEVYMRAGVTGPLKAVFGG